MRAHRSLAFISLVAIALAGGAIAFAQGHVMQALPDAKFGPAPPMLPPGAEIAVLSGDPGKSAPYSVRLKFPANYAIPAHSHPTDENVVVVSGGVYMGMGNTLDRTAGQLLGVGGFALVPAGANHYAYTKVASTIVLYGVGPVEFKYVNPSDDPRNTKK